MNSTFKKCNFVIGIFKIISKIKKAAWSILIFVNFLSNIFLDVFLFLI